MRSNSFSRYELLEKLDHICGGDVYRARELDSSREVLVRLLPAEIAVALREQGHDAAEARRIASLSHPNILTVYEFRCGNGHPFVVSEPFDGYTLAQRLRQGPMPLEEVLTVATSVAEGLRYAHQHGVVHGHLNPEQVWMSPNGAVKVVNFGFRRLRNGIAEDLLGRQARIYEAPEQWRGETATPLSDLFSFGLILLEMLVGRPPERDADGAVRFGLPLSRSEERQRVLYERVHPGLNRLIRACTAADPGARCPNFDEVQRQLVAANALYVEASKKYAWRSPNPFWRSHLWRHHFAATAAVWVAVLGLLAAVALVIFR